MQSRGSRKHLISLIESNNKEIVARLFQEDLFDEKILDLTWI